MAILSVLDGAGASAWQAAYLYQAGTVVTSGGSIWVANALNIGETPGSGHSWDSLVKGEALIDTVTNGNGLTLTGTTLAMAAATGTTAGAVAASGTQTFGVTGSFAGLLSPTYDVASAGTLTLGGTTATGVALGSAAVTSGQTFTSGLTAANAGTDFILNSSAATRTAGNLFQVQNNATPEMTLGFGGNLTLVGTLTAGAGGINLPANANALSFNGTTCISQTSLGMSIRGNAANGASAIGVILNNYPTLSTAGALITSFQNNGTQEASIDYAGNGSFNGAVSATNVGCTVWSTLSAQSQTSNGTANTYNQWTTGFTGGGTNGSMSFASSTITVTNAGTYAVTFSGTCSDGTAGSGFTSFQIWSGGAAIAGGTTTVSTATQSQAYGFCISTVVTVSASATFKVYFASSLTSQSITVSGVLAAERLY